MDRRAVVLSSAAVALGAVAWLVFARQQPDTEGEGNEPVKPNGETFEASEVAEIFRELSERLTQQMVRCALHRPAIKVLVSLIRVWSVL